MSSNFRLLVIAAGRGLGLDGFQKLNLVAPSTNESIIERYHRQLSIDIAIVVGYRAPELISQHPGYEYIYNHRWFETGSAFSAAVGLTSSPVVVCPSDLFFDDDVAEVIKRSTDNALFTVDSENRHSGAVNVSSDRGVVTDIYQGSRLNGEDREFTGLVRIQDDDLILKLIDFGQKNSHLAFFECLLAFKSEFNDVQLPSRVVEINKVEEYVNFVMRDKQRAAS